MRRLRRKNRNIALLSFSAILAAAWGQSCSQEGGDQSNRAVPTSQDVESGAGGGGGGGENTVMSTGSPCSSDNECAEGRCITEAGSGWPAGYCSGSCDVTCDEGAVCAGGSCFRTCTQNEDCRAAYKCGEVADGITVCLPGCTADADCPLTTDCDEDRGLCAPAPEASCDDFKDNDGDGLIDCEDATGCRSSASCAPGDKDAGAPCSVSSECKATGGDPLCMSEEIFGWPAGSCSEFCVIGEVGGCSGDAVCVDMDLPSGHGACFDACATDADCATPGYACEEESGGVKVCKAHCTVDAQCSAYCNMDTNLCSRATEDCANGLDDDDDEQPDCQDLDCAGTCGALLESACGAAAPAQATNHGDTASGTSLFGGSCTGDDGKEQIFTVTPGNAGETGTLSIKLRGAADLGVYVRSVCLDEEEELGCKEEAPGGGEESLEVAVQGGQTYAIFVDGFGANEEGAFDLDVSFTSATCGDGVVVAPEECDDGNAASGDGCDATCKIEAGSVCASATPIQATNAGNTEGGSNAFEGSCTGTDAFERIYTMTPPADGTLSLRLESESDQGIYVRTACGDATSEVDCADFNEGGVDETLSIPVTGGVPLYIFVDGYDTPVEAGPFELMMTFTP